jgi:chromosome segregation ATPase
MTDDRVPSGQRSFEFVYGELSRIRTRQADMDERLESLAAQVRKVQTGRGDLHSETAALREAMADRFAAVDARLGVLTAQVQHLTERLGSDGALIRKDIATLRGAELAAIRQDVSALRGPALDLVRQDIVRTRRELAEIAERVDRLQEQHARLDRAFDDARHAFGKGTDPQLLAALHEKGARS